MPVVLAAIAVDHWNPSTFATYGPSILEVDFGAGALLVVVYVAGMESSRYQATIGKLAVGMKVTDLNGNRISFVRALLRFFASYFTALSYVGWLMIPFTPKRQSLHDYLARTVVIKA